ncbi:AAA family ATPase [Acinetobacter bereziniae]|uniref:AAA family ATPase n=1 Tax=Acinetobacter bereziniae TaxID=106648 RepID=UPI00300A44CF
MKIKKVEIQGFRAYKTKSDGTFNFKLNENDVSNFIAIYAPNGFGKSSFYDAVEWGITGNISRYITDNNRKYNEQAARSTKQDGVPQIILRNKDVDSNIQTYVSLETTIGNFYKPWVKPRVDSMDLKFNESDTDKNYIFFRNVVLSQDNIDRFIREIKPENRYKNFMEDFCGDVEYLRRKLTILINENKQKVDDINTKRKLILEELQIPVNENVFDEYNSYVSEINKSGETLPLVTNGFDSTLEHEIISISNRRKIEIEKNLSYLESVKIVYIESKSKLNEFKSRLAGLDEMSHNLDILNSSFDKINKYNELYNSYLVYSKDLEGVVSEISKIDEVYGNINQYEIIENNIQSKLKELEVKKLEKVNCENKNEELSKLLVDNEAEILTLNRDIHNLEEKFYNSESKFIKSRDLSVEISSLDADISLDNKILDSLKLEKKVLDDEVEKLLNFDISINGVISNNIGVIESNNDTIETFYQNISKLRSIEHTENYAKEVQSSLSKQMNIAEKIALLGVEYVALNETSICPLCQHKHNTHSDLRNFIETNNLVTELAHSNAVKIAELLKEKNNIEQMLNLNLKEFEESKNSKLGFLNGRLVEINKKINEKIIKINSSINLMSKLKIDYEDNLKYLDYMDLNDFINSIKPKIDSFKNILVEKQNRVRSLRESISKLKDDIGKLDNDLSLIFNNIANLRINYSYYSVFEYLKSKNISADLFKSSYANKVESLYSTKEHFNKQLFNISGECNLLRENLIESKNWIPLDELNLKINDLNNLIFSENLYINSFCNAVKYKSNDNNYSKIDEFIDNAVNNIDLEVSLARNLSFKFDVILGLIASIKPYSNNLKLKEELSKIDGELIKYNNVDDKLSEELGNVVGYLSEYIKSFFYNDLINSIYKKIDPHPHFKEVVFEPDFSVLDKPCLNILIKDEKDQTISPIIYFSSAQLNILSLSVFLSRAIHAKDNYGNALKLILIDDPIQAMDSINILSTIDLLRSISLRFDKQIIISTHDENFYRLLQKKVPTHFFNSKFFRLSSYGVVEQQV